MYIKGLIAVLIFSFFSLSYSPNVFAADSAKKVNEIIQWWEKYGKHWDKVKKKPKDKKVATVVGK